MLHKFMCRQFGYFSMDDMLNELRDVPVSFPVLCQNSALLK